MAKRKFEFVWEGKDREEFVPEVELVERADLSNVEGDPNTENMLIKGENLSVLKALEKDYAGKVKCIYIDPPYNTGQMFLNYGDRFDKADFYSFLRARVSKLRDFLAEDGTFWMSISNAEQPKARLILEEIFGANNLLADVVWERSEGCNSGKHFAAVFEHVLVFAKKRAAAKINLNPRSAERLKDYKNPDNDPRGPWTSKDLTAQVRQDSRLDYKIKTPKGLLPPPPVRLGRLQRKTTTSS